MSSETTEPTAQVDALVLRFFDECMKLVASCDALIRDCDSEGLATDRSCWESREAGVKDSVAVMQRLLKHEADHGLRVDDCAMRDQIKRLADEWCVHSSNGMDVLASQCLDEIESKVTAIRP
jgi:hypothetical protein